MYEVSNYNCNKFSPLDNWNYIFAKLHVAGGCCAPLDLSSTSPDFLNNNMYPYYMAGSWSISPITPTFNNRCVKLFKDHMDCFHCLSTGPANSCVNMYTSVKNLMFSVNFVKTVIINMIDQNLVYLGCKYKILKRLRKKVTQRYTAV
jgi:hypothetical protein